MNPPLHLLAVTGWGHRGAVWERLALPGVELHPRALPGHEADPAPDCSLEAAATSWGGHWDLAIGWSLGGLAILHALERHWIRPRALILIATPPAFLAHPGYSVGMPESRLEAFRAELGKDLRGTLRRFYALQFHGDKAPRGCWAPARFRDRYLAYEAGAQVLTAWLDILGNLNRVAHPPAWEIPVLLLHGSRDAIVSPAASRFFWNCGPRVATAIIPGAGHAPHITHTAKIERHIGDFLRARVA